MADNEGNADESPLSPEEKRRKRQTENARKKRGLLPLPEMFAFQGDQPDTSRGPNIAPGPSDAFGSGVSFDQAMARVQQPIVAPQQPPMPVAPQQGNDQLLVKIDKLTEMLNEVLTIVKELQGRDTTAVFE